MVAVASPAHETFAALVEKGASIAEISIHLDGLAEAERIREMYAMTGALEKKVWDLAKGKGTVDIAAFVEGSKNVNIYAGKNSLALFTHFQKRFYRAAGGEVAGYNHNGGFVTFFTGPGYFVVEPANDGELVFDYTRLPKEKPDEWPAVRENKGLLAGAVYGGMLDYVRYVSKHTVIGAAFIDGKARDAYFLLTRKAETTPG